MCFYVLGAGASVHAGYPLCSALWSRMAKWVIERQTVDSEFRKAVDVIAAVNGPVKDIESMFTYLDLGQGPFDALTEDDRNFLRGRIRGCLRAYFCSISNMRREAHLYRALAKSVSNGDVIVTFNYDVALESEFVRAARFRVRNGYGFPADWDEPDSDVIILKLHGSINWIGGLFGGETAGYGVAYNSLDQRPFVDNVDLVLPDYPKSCPGQILSRGWCN
jgi:hypothetical protein